MDGSLQNKNKNKPRYLEIVLIFSLVIMTLAVYWQTKNNGFVVYDDNVFVTDNPHVQKGFNAESIKWAFTAPRTANWNPLTWLSHMLDYRLYGLNPSGHHLTNLLLHIANTVLLFLLLNSMTSAPLRSSFVAALFALHPLHVESVAWIAERKDVLSTFFFLLTIWTYGLYARQQNFKRYSLCLIFFILGLLAKPMLVTLPFILLLLDYWPLGRLYSPQPGNNASLVDSESPDKIPGSIILRLIAEKVPFFVFSLIVSVITLYAQKIAMLPLESLPIKIRIMNALVSYIKYIGKLIWPSHLAVFYPIPVNELTVWRVLGSVVILAAISILIIRSSKKYKYLAVGWFWYLGTLVPVIGLVQVGLQAMADRYTYIPSIGLFVIAAWGVPDILGKFKHRKIVLALLAASVITAMTIVTSNQLRYWKNSVTLFTHAIKVTNDNFIAYNNLAIASMKAGRYAETLPILHKAMTINPNFSRNYATPIYNTAYVYAQMGKFDEAIPYLNKVLKLNPDYAEAHNLLGYCLHRTKKYDEAIKHYTEAIRLKPDYADAHNNLGILLDEMGRTKEAYNHYLVALQIKPTADTLNNFGVLYENQGKYDDAVKLYSAALRLDPGFQAARDNLRNVLKKLSGNQKAGTK